MKVLSYRANLLLQAIHDRVVPIQRMAETVDEVARLIDQGASVDVDLLSNATPSPIHRSYRAQARRDLDIILSARRGMNDLLEVVANNMPTETELLISEIVKGH